MTCAAISSDHAKVVRAGLATTVILTFAMGLIDAFWFWAAVRFVAGAVSAWTFVFASQWGLRRLGELGAHQWSGVIYTGPGVGIVVTGLLGAAAGPLGAAAAWIGFAALSAVAGAVRLADIRQRPVREALRRAEGQRSRRARTALTAAPPDKHRAQALWLAVLYGLPGFGYIITGDFPARDRPRRAAGLALARSLLARFRRGADPGRADRVATTACLGQPRAARRLLPAAGRRDRRSASLFPTTAGFALGSLMIGLPFTAITLFAMREARRLRGERAAGPDGLRDGRVQRRTDRRAARRGTGRRAHRLVFDRAVARGGGARRGQRGARSGLPRGTGSDSRRWRTRRTRTPPRKTKKPGSVATDQAFFLIAASMRVRRAAQHGNVGGDASKLLLHPALDARERRRQVRRIGAARLRHVGPAAAACRPPAARRS